MIIQTKALKLVKIYSTICEKFEKDEKYIYERFSNNNKQRFTVKQIQGFECDYFALMISKFRFL